MRAALAAADASRIGHRFSIRRSRARSAAMRLSQNAPRHTPPATCPGVLVPRFRSRRGARDGPSVVVVVVVRACAGGPFHSVRTYLAGDMRPEVPLRARVSACPEKRPECTDDLRGRATDRTALVARLR